MIISENKQEMAWNGNSSRRGFLMTQLAAGFALAVQPITADAIHTGTEGLEAGEVKIPSGEIEIPGYYARPANAAKSPTVLVVEEIFGVHEHIKDLCRRLAREGYYALAPELFARQGDPSKIAEIDRLVKEVVSKKPDAEATADLDAAVAFAGKSGKADTSRLGITGFCWGGRMVWLYAAHSPRLKAGAAWYGRLVGGQQTNPLQPQQPIQLVSEMKAPVIGLYGGKDQGIPVASVQQMEAALKAAGKEAEFHIYPEAGHAFNADYRPSYNADAARDAWARMLAFFRQHGVAA